MIGGRLVGRCDQAGPPYAWRSWGCSVADFAFCPVNSQTPDVNVPEALTTSVEEFV